MFSKEKEKYLKYKNKYLKLKELIGGIIPTYNTTETIENYKNYLPYKHYNFIIDGRIIGNLSNLHPKNLTFDENFNIIDYTGPIKDDNIKFSDTYCFANNEIFINENNKFPFHICFINSIFKIMNSIYKIYSSKNKKDINILNILFHEKNIDDTNTKIDISINNQNNIFNRYVYINKLRELLEILYDDKIVPNDFDYFNYLTKIYPNNSNNKLSYIFIKKYNTISIDTLIEIKDKIFAEEEDKEYKEYKEEDKEEDKEEGKIKKKAFKCKNIEYLFLDIDIKQQQSKDVAKYNKSKKLYLDICDSILNIFDRNYTRYINFSDMIILFNNYIQTSSNDTQYNYKFTEDKNIYDNIDTYLLKEVDIIIKIIINIQEIDKINKIDNIKFNNKISHIIISNYIYQRIFDINLITSKKSLMPNNINITNLLENLFNKKLFNEKNINEIKLEIEIDEKEPKFKFERFIKPQGVILTSDHNMTYRGKSYKNCFENTMYGFIKILTFIPSLDKYDNTLYKDTKPEIKDIINRININDNNTLIDEFAILISDYINNDTDNIFINKQSYFSQPSQLSETSKINDVELNLDINKFKTLVNYLFGFNIDNINDINPNIIIKDLNDINIEITAYEFKYNIMLKYDVHGATETASDITALYDDIYDDYSYSIISFIFSKNNIIFNKLISDYENINKLDCNDIINIVKHYNNDVEVFKKLNMNKRCTYEILTLLINKGFDIKNHQDIILKIIKAIDIHTNKYKNDIIKIFNLLLDNGIDINYAEKSQNALYFACFKSNSVNFDWKQIIDFLLCNNITSIINKTRNELSYINNKELNKNYTDLIIK